jgi:hypothetical protein
MPEDPLDHYNPTFDRFLHAIVSMSPGKGILCPL